MKRVRARVEKRCKCWRCDNTLQVLALDDDGRGVEHRWLPKTFQVLDKRMRINLEIEGWRAGPPSVRIRCRSTLAETETPGELAVRVVGPQTYECLRLGCGAAYEVRPSDLNDTFRRTEGHVIVLGIDVGTEL